MREVQTSNLLPSSYAPQAPFSCSARSVYLVVQIKKTEEGGESMFANQQGSSGQSGSNSNRGSGSDTTGMGNGAGATDSEMDTETGME